MPEGPEIRLEADQIAGVLERETIERVELTIPELKPYAGRLRDARVVRVYPRGKAMLVELDSGFTIYSHNQLYGRWVTRRKGKLPQTNRQLRLALYTAKGVAALYSASDVDILTSNELLAHPFLSKLGPDVLDEKTTAALLADRLTKKAFRNRTLGSLFLDQNFLAGVGNYLRTEILFNAELHPKCRPADLTAAQKASLAKVCLKICQRAYKTRGVVNAPTRVAALRAQGLKRSDYRFAVFGREDHPCYVCGTNIQRIAVTSRRLYLCPTCQPECVRL